jgi:tetratricopeptide (TPR) repeat protein
MLLGLTYAGQGKSADALAQYMAAAQLSTCDPAILLLLGGAQAEAGEIKAAADTYAQALAIDPQNPDVLFSVGANHLMLGDDAAAVENLAALVAVRPQMSKAHYYLGVAYEELGERDKAQSAYAEAARLAAGASPPPLDLAYAYEKLGRVDDAITVYVQLLAEHESPDLHTYLGALYADKGAGDLARAEYARALELDPEQTLARFALANLDFAAGNWQAAAGGYEALLGQEESASLHEYAAQAYLQLGDLAAAFRHQQAAAQLESTRAELWARLALMANWLNRLGDAGYAADQALRLKPDDAAVYFTRGQIAYKRCDLSEAVANLQRATELVPDNPLYLGSLGGYYSARGDMESVAPLLAELQAGGPADYFAHWLAGDLLALRDGKAALAEYAKALQPPDLSPGVAAALHAAVGQQYLLTGNTAAAAAAYTQALAQAPDYIDAEIGLGDLAWLAGDPEGAQNHYRAAVATLPAYAAKYSYDKAAIVAPALQARLALTARARGDLRDEAAALAAAEEQLDALRAAAPQWAVVAVVEGMMALVKADSTAADDAFARAIACDKTLGDTRRRIEALVAGTE